MKANVQPELSVALARAMLDAEIVGVAVLRGPERTHVLANRTYERLVSPEAPVAGRLFRDVVSRESVPDVVLQGVLGGGGHATAIAVDFVRTRADGTNATQHVSLSFFAVEEEPGTVLVTAQDFTERTRAIERSDLFVALASELLSAVEPRAAIRSVVDQTTRALRAKSASLFTLDAGGRTLRGAPGEWDWTRTSFEVALRDWPTVEASLASRSARFLTAKTARGSEGGWFEARGTVGALCVPLVVAGRRRGVLFFDFESTRTPSPGAMEFADRVAEHCAAALERALAGDQTVAPTPRFQHAG